MNNRHPADPRAVFPGHHERGPRRGSFTYEDVARVTGLTKGTVIAYAHRGKLSLDDFDSVAAFLRSHLPTG